MFTLWFTCNLSMLGEIRRGSGLFDMSKARKVTRGENAKVKEGSIGRRKGVGVKRLQHEVGNEGSCTETEVEREEDRQSRAKDSGACSLTR